MLAWVYICVLLSVCLSASCLSVCLSVFLSVLLSVIVPFQVAMRLEVERYMRQLVPPFASQMLFLSTHCSWFQCARAARGRTETRTGTESEKTKWKFVCNKPEKSYCIYDCVHKSDSGIYAAVNSTIISRSARLSTRPKRPRATSRQPFSWAWR